MVAYQPLWTKKGQYHTLTGLDDRVRGLLTDYEKLNATIYEWSGLEDLEIKPRFLESLFFWNVAIGILPNNILMGAVPVIFDAYGEPHEWTPVPTYLTTLPHSIMRKYQSKDNPCIRLGGDSVADSIKDECVDQASGYISANQNVLGMRMPVMFSGVNSKAEIRFMQNRLEQGGNVPYVDGGKDSPMGMEVLDLKVNNYLDPLTGYNEFIHTKILAKLGIDALGAQKASGVTQEEATMILAQIRGVRELNLQLRKDFCKMVNEHIENVNIGVEIRDIYMNEQYDRNDNETADGDDIGDNNINPKV